MVSSLIKKLMMSTVLGLAPLVYKTNADIEFIPIVTNIYDFEDVDDNREGYQVMYQWSVRNKDPPATNSVEDLVEKITIGENLENLGIYDFDNNDNDWELWEDGYYNFDYRNSTEWDNHANTDNTFSFEASLPGNEPIDRSDWRYFRAFIDKEKIIGNREVWIQGKSVVGDYTPLTLNTLITIPITPTTTTSNGTSVAALLGAGYNATNTMAYFENSSVQDANTNGVPDVLDWLVSGDTNYVGGLEGALTFTNGNSKVSWSPTVSNRVYDVNVKTNLMDEAWTKAGSVTNTGNGANSFIDTNSYDNAFYSVGVKLKD